MMFEILEPCRVLRLGTSSKKIYNKTNKNHDKNKNKNKKKGKREQIRKRKASKKKMGKRKISCLAEKPTGF